VHGNLTVGGKIRCNTLLVDGLLEVKKQTEVKWLDVASFCGSSLTVGWLDAWNVQADVVNVSSGGRVGFIACNKISYTRPDGTSKLLEFHRIVTSIGRYQNDGDPRIKKRDVIFPKR